MWAELYIQKITKNIFVIRLNIFIKNAILLLVAIDQYQ